MATSMLLSTGICGTPKVKVASLSRSFKGARLGWLGDYDGYLAMDDGVMALCEAALAKADALEIAEMKKQKLRLKEEISRLSQFA